MWFLIGNAVVGCSKLNAGGRLLSGMANHQHQALAHELTDQARFLVQEERLWRLVGASRLPGYGKHPLDMNIEPYVEAVVTGKRFDPVLSIHLKDGWMVVRPIHGYLQHDGDSVGWAGVIQWVNPACPPPPEFDLRKLKTSTLSP